MPALPLTLLLTILLAITFTGNVTHAARPDGQLELQIVEAKTGRPLPARIHLRDARRWPVRARDLGVAHHGDHFYIDGGAILGLRRGQYTFDLDAGWERRTQAGDFEIQRRADDTKTIEINGFADLAKEGWYAADLDANLPLIDLGVVLRAEQLAYAPLTAWRGEPERGWRRISKRPAGKLEFPPGVSWQAACYESSNGKLLLFSDGDELNDDALPATDDVTLTALRKSRDAGFRVVAADLTSWKLPIWLASDVLDAVSVLDRTSLFDGVDTKHRDGRPANRMRYPGAQGPGRWREAIYFHILNTGLRMPAVAGSGAGENDSPLGTNRVYAHCPNGFRVDQWWEAVDAGRTVVTNGPLLRPVVFGEAPGYVFRLDSTGHFQASIGLNLSTRQTIDYLELLRDGEVVESVRLADWATAGGVLPVLDFDVSGWFAARVVTAAGDRYQYALTSPYYVEGPQGLRISRASCQFFIDWLEEYEQQLKNPSETQGDELAAARQYWQARLNMATAP